MLCGPGQREPAPKFRTLCGIHAALGRFCAPFPTPTAWERLCISRIDETGPAKESRAGGSGQRVGHQIPNPPLAFAEPWAALIPQGDKALIEGGRRSGRQPGGLTQTARCLLHHTNREPIPAAAIALANVPGEVLTAPRS